MKIGTNNMERLRQSNAILRLLNLILFCRNFADSGIFDCNEMFEIRVIHTVIYSGETIRILILIICFKLFIIKYARTLLILCVQLHTI